MSSSARAIYLAIVGDHMHVDSPRGLLSKRDRDELRAAFDLIRPTLARACAPQLPPRETWPGSWREAWEERVAIVRESCANDVDPEAIADADLRVMIARGLVEQLNPIATSE